MAEPLVATYQHSQPGSSRQVLYSPVERSVSPKSERYRIKQTLLQEKFNIIEAQTNALRKRVQVVKKEVQQAMEVRRALCNILDEKGDRWYKGYIDMDLDDKYDLNPLHDFTGLFGRGESGAKKRSRPSGKSRSKAVKAKEEPKTTEQKLEEERAKAKIVSIIDSVFSETAKKTAKNEQEVRNRSSLKNAANRNNHASSHSARQSTGARTNRNGSGGASKASHSRKNNASRSNRALPYKVFSSKNQRKSMPTDTVNGVHEGIKFTYIPRTNGLPKRKSEKKTVTLKPPVQEKSQAVPETNSDNSKKAVNNGSEQTPTLKESFPEPENFKKPDNEEAPIGTSKETTAEETPVDVPSGAQEPAITLGTPEESASTMS